MEREIPGREPRVLPLVRHREDVGVVHVVPARVARRGRDVSPYGSGPTLGQPAVDVVVVELLPPQHPGERLPHDARPVLGQALGDHPGVEVVRLAPSRVDDRVEGLRRRGRELGRRAGPARPRLEQAEADRRRCPGLDRERVRRAPSFPSHPGSRSRVARDHVLLDRVLHPRRALGTPEQALGVRLVLGEEQVLGDRRRRASRRPTRASAA